MLFWDMAKQTKVAANDDDNAAFGWKEDSKVSMKLGPVDIAEILMVLTGKKAKVGKDGGSSVWRVPHQRLEKAFGVQEQGKS